MRIMVRRRDFHFSVSAVDIVLHVEVAAVLHVVQCLSNRQTSIFNNLHLFLFFSVGHEEPKSGNQGTYSSI